MSEKFDIRGCQVHVGVETTTAGKLTYAEKAKEAKVSAAQVIMVS